MNRDNVEILPVWKKGASAEDFFYDMALIARKYPERFERIVLCYEEMSKDNSSSKSDCYCHGVDTTTAYGVIESAKITLANRTRC